MAPKPHSKTVRGTLDNPKTQEAMNSSRPTPRLGDATSLKPANDDKELPSNDSAPPRGQGNDAGSKPSQGKGADSNPNASTPSDPLPKNAKPSSSSSDKNGDLPHSKKVRGTLANYEGKKVNKTQLGDPASVKVETSKSDMGKDGDKSAKSKL